MTRDPRLLAGMRGKWRVMKKLTNILLMAGLIGFGFQANVLAECISVTGSSSIDNACCVDSALNYSNSLGESTHDAYLACVGEAVVEARLDGSLSEASAESAVAEQAAASHVNR